MGGSSMYSEFMDEYDNLAISHQFYVIDDIIKLLYGIRAKVDIPSNLDIEDIPEEFIDEYKRKVKITRFIIRQVPRNKNLVVFAMEFSFDNEKYILISDFVYFDNNKLITLNKEEYKNELEKFIKSPDGFDIEYSFILIKKINTLISDVNEYIRSKLNGKRIIRNL